MYDCERYLNILLKVGGKDEVRNHGKWDRDDEVVDDGMTPTMKDSLFYKIYRKELLFTLQLVLVV